ncbi:hypothetical protein J6590_012184 [Homalodisca vitripennis]|nr:hypothetical protein J6590_012184 [Homalodisca vitripennis]
MYEPPWENSAFPQLKRVGITRKRYKNWIPEPDRNYGERNQIDGYLWKLSPTKIRSRYTAM